MVAILNSAVSNSHYVMLRGQICMYLPRSPDQPKIAIWDDGIKDSFDTLASLQRTGSMASENVKSYLY